MTNPTQTKTSNYNLSERAILESLDADSTSFKGREFHDRVCLMGHKAVGRRILNLDGAVFHEEVNISLTDWQEVSIAGAHFKKGFYMSYVSTTKLHAANVRIDDVADLMGVTTASADFTGAKLPEDTRTRKGDSLHEILAVKALVMDAR